MRQHIGFLLKSINDKLKANADEDLKKHNLTLSQSRVVTFLAEKGGEATQKEIEDNLGVSHPTVVGLVSRMEQNGIVVGYDSKSRSKSVRLTEQALSIANELNSTIELNESKILAGISSEDEDKLRKTLIKILDNLES